MLSMVIPEILEIKFFLVAQWYRSILFQNNLKKIRHPTSSQILKIILSNIEF